MKPKNTEIRNQVILRFAGFYIASIVLIILIFSAFSDKPEPVQQDMREVAVEKPLAAPTSVEPEQVLQETGLLYTPLEKLNGLRKSYAVQMGNGSPSTKLETTRKLIQSTEAKYRKTVDSIERAAVKYKLPAHGSLVRRIVAFSRLALENPAPLPDVPTAPLQEPLTTQPVDKQAEATAQKELARRSARISELESQLRSQQRENRSLRLALTGNSPAK